jgi:hypothetical protein
MTVHELKIWPEFFTEIQKGQKKFEVRRDDRKFEVGDLLHLKEWEPLTKKYSGRECCTEVEYKMHGGTWGIREDFCVLGIRKLAADNPKKNLCDTCQYTVPECLGTEIVWGNGKGKDNVLDCNKFRESRA